MRAPGSDHASHNPWTDNGFKEGRYRRRRCARDAGSHRGDHGRPSRGRAAASPGLRRCRGRRPGRDLRPVSALPQQLASIVDLERIARRLASPGRADTAPAGWFTRLLGGEGSPSASCTPSATFFGGVNPEPIRPNIDAWLEEIPRWGADIGIAFDGDADRVGMATEEGVFVNQLQVYALLYWYLLEVRRSALVYTVTSTSMAPRLAEIYGTQAYETGVGFKYVGPKMTETHAVIGGEESGGFGFGMHIPERDGLASGLFLLDLWLTKAKKASEVLAELQALAGPSYYNRIDIRFARRSYEAVKADTLGRLEHEAPETAGRAVVRRRAGDRRRLQVLPGRRIVAPDPLGHRGAAAHLRRGAIPADVEALLEDGRRIAAAGVPGRPDERRPRLLRLQAPRRGAGRRDEPGPDDPTAPPQFDEAITLDDAR